MRPISHPGYYEFSDGLCILTTKHSKKSETGIWSQWPEYKRRQRHQAELAQWKVGLALALTKWQARPLELEPSSLAPEFNPTQRGGPRYRPNIPVLSVQLHGYLFRRLPGIKAAYGRSCDSVRSKMTKVTSEFFVAEVCLADTWQSNGQEGSTAESTWAGAETDATQVKLSLPDGSSWEEHLVECFDFSERRAKVEIDGTVATATAEMEEAPRWGCEVILTRSDGSSVPATLRLGRRNILKAVYSEIMS